MAQLVARTLWEREASSSSLLTPTIFCCPKSRALDNLSLVYALVGIPAFALVIDHDQVAISVGFATNGVKACWGSINISTLKLTANRTLSSRNLLML